MREHGIQIENTYFRLLHDVPHVSAVLEGNHEVGKYVSYILHSHPFYELFVCENHSIEIKIPNGVITVEPGDVVIIPPGKEHVKLPTDPRTRWKSVCFSYFQRKRSSQDLYHDLTQFLGQDEPIHIKHHHDISIQLCRLADLATTTRSKYLAITLADILVRLADMNTGILRASGAEPSNAAQKNDDVDIIGSTRLENMLASQFMTDLTTKKAAEQFHISVRQLDRLSTKYYGVTFRRTMMQRRIRVAIEMFNSTQLSIEQISAAIGFSSRMSFTRAFISEYGMGPGEYRKTYFQGKKNAEDAVKEERKENKDD
ncbi:MAG: helix-turn-helix domain-containing protein [Clostridia bacterium]|nr:helix-turn-helix domain-containing protein [Clostridia bacterium]